MKASFNLLGKCDNSNPSSISLKQIHHWEEEKWITYLGETDCVRDFIAKHSCIILPSYKEGIPRSLLEAMSMEKPIITTDVSGCRECICNPREMEHFKVGDNGILIPPKNPLSLAKAIEYFLSLSNEQKKEMGRQGRKYAKTRFEISHTIQHYQQVLSPYSNSTQKNLIFISNTSFGMYNFRLPILQSLQKQGFVIHIISPIDSTTQLLKDKGFFHHPISINPKGLNPLEDLLLAYKLRKMIRSIRPILVFNYTIKPAIYGSIACNLLKIPNIAVITGLGYVFIDGGLKKKLLKHLVCFLYRYAFLKTDKVWFLNSDDKETFINHKILDSSKAKILDGEGIDTDFFSPQNYPQDEPNFLLIARMLWDKGIGELIEAIKILKNPH